jgi:hypothetical protein
MLVMPNTDDEVKRYTANVWLNITPDGVSLADPELRSVVLAQDHDRIVSSLRAENAALELSVAEAGGAFELCDRENERLRAEVERLGKDARRLDFLEAESTLHKQPEILYVVDGYLLEIVDERSRTMRAGKGETLRAAIDSAMEKPE